MTELPALTIYLNNTPWYEEPENQHAVWSQTKTNVEQSGLSHEKYIEAISAIIFRLELKVFTPLLGDLASKGFQHYLISKSSFLWDRRWFSYYLLANENGLQKHSPTRLVERVKENHLANEVIAALLAHYGLNDSGELFRFLFPKNRHHFYDNARKSSNEVLNHGK